MFRLFCLLIGYVFGLIPTAYIVGKAQGIDIREHGSGNAGTTNTLRVLGKRSGGIVLAGDLLKCFLGIFVACLIFKKLYPDYYYLIKIYTAFGIILGHDYPFFLHFKGGKGIACFGGMALSFFGPIIPACVVTFFGTFFLTHYVSLSSIMLLFTFLAEVIIFGQAGFLGMSQIALLELYGVVFALVILALFQHRKNIVRLIKGEERRTYLRKKSEERIDRNKMNSKTEFSGDASNEMSDNYADKGSDNGNSLNLDPVLTETETETTGICPDEPTNETQESALDETTIKMQEPDSDGTINETQKPALNESRSKVRESVLEDNKTESIQSEESYELSGNVSDETKEPILNSTSNNELSEAVSDKVLLDEDVKESADEELKESLSAESSFIEDTTEHADTFADDENIEEITELMEEIVKPARQKQNSGNNRNNNKHKKKNNKR